MDVLSPGDALKILAQWLGEKGPDTLPSEAAEVARECGYLPLALAMIGAMIRLQPTAWEDAWIGYAPRTWRKLNEHFPVTLSQTFLELSR